MLIEIVQNRLRERKRTELLQNMAQAEQDYAQGKVCRGSVTDLMTELEDILLLAIGSHDEVY